MNKCGQKIQKAVSLWITLLITFNFYFPGLTFAEEIIQESSTEEAIVQDTLTEEETSIPTETSEQAGDEETTIPEESTSETEESVEDITPVDIIPEEVQDESEEIIPEPVSEPIDEVSVANDVVVEENLGTEAQEVPQEASNDEPSGDSWAENEDGSYTTGSAVETGKTYEFPQNTDLSVTFKSLPDEPGTLTIKEVKLSDEEVESLGALTNSAYEITSTMEDGAFEYDLTLPAPDEANSDTEVKYAEDTSDIENAEQVDKPTQIEGDKVTVYGLDHFTVFVLVNDTDNGGSPSTTDDVANGQITTLKDAWIDETAANQDENHGDEQSFKVQSRDSGRNQRALIQFDLTPVSSANTVDKATLRLYMNNAPTNNRTYQIYRLDSADWVEGNGGANNNPSGEVSWNNKPTSSLDATSTTSITGNGDNIWVEFDVTADVTAFLAGTPAPNYGWLIQDASESESSTARTSTFLSRQSGTQNQRPQLVVDFTESSDEPTQYNSPSASVADTGGDGDGFENNSNSAFSDGGAEAVNRCTTGTDLANTIGYASNCAGTGDRHIFYNYGFTVPAGSVINGIEVRADWFMDETTGTNSLGVELSWDQGTTWTTAKTDTTETNKEHISSFGGGSDDWGKVWNSEEFSNDNFRVRLTSTSSASSQDFALDWIPVRVYYTPETTEPATSYTSTPPAFTNDNTLDYAGTSTDDASGIALVEYRITSLNFGDDYDWTPATTVDGAFDNELSENFTFTTPGLLDDEYDIETRATDAAGNIESTATHHVTVDTVDPILFSKTTFSGWYTSDQTSIFTYTDATSGISGPDNVSCDITTEGVNQTCTVDDPNICDLAGNCNNDPVTSNGADIDKSLPTDPDPSSSSHTVSSWNSDTTVNVTWSGASDPGGSGVDGFYTEWNTSDTTITGPVTKVYEETDDSEESPLLSTGHQLLTWAHSGLMPMTQ